MLETRREYGAERLAAQGLGPDAHDAAARYALAVVARADAMLRGPAQARALRVFDAERDNIAAALAHLVDRGDTPAALRLVQHLGWYWVLREQGEDALRWTAAVLALPGAMEEPLAPVVRAMRVAVAAAVPGSDTSLDGGQDGGQRVEGFGSAADALDGADDSHPPARVLRPVLLFFAERRDEALRLIDDLVTNDPDPWVRAATRTTRMAFAENDGELDRMRRDVEVGVREWTALEDSWGLAAVLSSRGQLRAMDGDLEGAAADYAEAQRRVRSLGAASDDLMSSMRMCDLRLRAGDPAGARAHVEAMRRSRSPGELEVMRDVLAEVMEAGVVLVEQDTAAARITRARLLAALRATDEPSPFQAHAAAVGYGMLAVLDLVTGEREAVGDHIREGYRQAVRTNDLPILAAVGLAVADVALDADRPLAAAEIVGAAAHLRGAEDPGSPAVRRVVVPGRARAGEQAWDEAFRRGRAMTRAEAIRRLDPELLATDDPAGDADDPAPAPGIGSGNGAVSGLEVAQARRR
jgi:hypothetical protein